MSSIEGEPTSESQLSQEVVQRLARACQALHPYGEHVQTGKLVLDELYITENDNLAVMEGLQSQRPTHQASGIITIPELMFDVRVWTPLEGVKHRKVTIRGDEVTLSTIIQDHTTTSNVYLYPPESQTHIMTRENRVYQIITREMYNQTESATRELTEDLDVEFYTKEILESSIRQLSKLYPGVAHSQEF